MQAEIRSTRGRWRVIALLGFALSLAAPTASIAMTPVDGRGLSKPLSSQPGQVVQVAAPALVTGTTSAVTDWSEGCLRNPAAAERLRQLHLNMVKPLALALHAPVLGEGTPEWASCR